MHHAAKLHQLTKECNIRILRGFSLVGNRRITTAATFRLIHFSHSFEKCVNPGNRKVANTETGAHCACLPAGSSSMLTEVLETLPPAPFSSPT